MKADNGLQQQDCVVRHDVESGAGVYAGIGGVSELLCGAVLCQGSSGVKESDDGGAICGDGVGLSEVDRACGVNRGCAG